MSPSPHPGLNAYTLIELLCVIAIIGILASLTFVPVSKAYTRAKRLPAQLTLPPMPR
jgi:prepilin-type N-terminal cleavage/methylation domain-containing protein